jgi:hypothetical protein
MLGYAPFPIELSGALAAGLNVISVSDDQAREG